MHPTRLREQFFQFRCRCYKTPTANVQFLFHRDHLIICARTYFVNANSTIRTSNTKTSGMTFVAPQSCSSCLVAHPLPRCPSVRRSSSGGYSAQLSGRPDRGEVGVVIAPPLLLTRASSSEGSCSHRKQPADRLHGVWSFGALGDCAKVHKTMYDFKRLSLRKEGANERRYHQGDRLAESQHPRLHQRKRREEDGPCRRVIQKRSKGTQIPGRHVNTTAVG